MTGQTLADEHQPDAAYQLDQRQQGSAANIKVIIQCLINRQFNGSCRRAATECQHRGKTGKAEHKNQCGGRQQLTAQIRPLHNPEMLPFIHIKLSGELSLLRGNIIELLIQHPGGKRHIEEDVRQQNAL